MKENEFNESADLAMRNAGGRARCPTAPEDMAMRAGDDDASLGRLLASLPRGPGASSNFAARVMEEIDALERRDAGRRRVWALGWKTWLSLGASAAAVVLVARLGGVNEGDSATTRGLETVMTASAVIESKSGGAVSAGRTLEVWKDFDAIRKLNQPAVEADWGLLAALQ